MATTKTDTAQAEQAATLTAAALIDESVLQTSIARAAYTEALHEDLLVECEDSTETGDVVEYWGTAESGSAWRVHLTRE